MQKSVSHLFIFFFKSDEITFQNYLFPTLMCVRFSFAVDFFKFTLRCFTFCKFNYGALIIIRS